MTSSTELEASTVPAHADDLEKLVEQEMDRANVPGLAVGVLRRGELSYARGFGVTSVEDPLPVTPDTVFRIGSVTKMFTATIIMRLVELGELGLDEPIDAYSPGLELRGTDPGRITLRLLLSHRAGLQNGPVVGRTEPSLIDRSLPPTLRRYAPVAAPDTVVSYSNLSIVLAGHIAEVATGTPFAELAHDLLFAPLEMRRTTFDPSLAMTYRLAQAHNTTSTTELVVRHEASDYPCLYPGSFAFSTISDLAKFARAHMSASAMSGGELLSPPYRLELHEPHADWMMGDGLKSGLGCYIDHHNGWKRVGHPGIFFSGGAKLAILPEVGAGAVLLYNYGEGIQQGMFRLGREVVFRALYEFLDVPHATAEPVEPVEPAETPVVADSGHDLASPASYLGRYIGPDYDGAVLVDLQPDRLELEIAGTSVALKRQDDGVFVARTPPRQEMPWHHVAYHTSYDLYVALLPPSPEASPEATRWIMVNGKPYRRLPDRRPDGELEA